MLKEIFYRKDGFFKNSKRTYNNYLSVILRFGLTNIVNNRLLVKDVKDYKCNIHNACGCNYEKHIRKNYALYCEVLSYNVCADDIKYIAIKFHRYTTFYQINNNIPMKRSINCEILEQLPMQYDLISIKPIYFSITAGSFDELNKIIENEVFIFSEFGNTCWYSEGYYKLKLELFVKPRYTTSVKREIEYSDLLLRNIIYESIKK